MVPFFGIQYVLKLVEICHITYTEFITSAECQLPPATTTVVSLLLKSHTPTFWSLSPLGSGLLLIILGFPTIKLIQVSALIKVY